MPGEMRRNSLTHVARGSDGALFFQWRASVAGAEKFHSGLLPHAGTDTALWQNTVQLGQDLAAISEIKGSTVAASTAIVWDWDAWWGAELDAHPSRDLRYSDTVHDVHAALWRLGITADVVHPDDDLSTYRLVVVPTLYTVADATAGHLADYVSAGGHAVVTYFSGIVDKDNHIRLGGYPGAFRDLLGVRIEEFCPLPEKGTVHLSDGSVGSVWSERGRVTTADVVATYADGPAIGSPAVTRAQHGSGIAWYVGTRLDPDSWDGVLATAAQESGVQPVIEAPAGLEAVRRVADDGASWLFLLNHLDTEVTVTAGGTDLLTGQEVDGAITVAAGGVAVVRERK
jgi:beta-galactosidase